jgi:hypothetical protein
LDGTSVENRSRYGASHCINRMKIWAPRLRRRFSFWARPVGLGAGSPQCLTAGSTGTALQSTRQSNLARRRRMVAIRQSRLSQICFDFVFCIPPSAPPHETGRLVRSRRSRPASFEDCKNVLPDACVHARRPASRPLGALRAWSPHVLCYGSRAACRGRRPRLLLCEGPSPGVTGNAAQNDAPVLGFATPLRISSVLTSVFFLFLLTLLLCHSVILSLFLGNDLFFFVGLSVALSN